MKLRLILACMLMLIVTATTVSHATESPLGDVFRDTIYGGAIGTLVGGASMAFTRKPANHLENLGYGGAVGIIAGAAFGMARTARSLAEIDNGRVKLAMPTLIPNLTESPVTKQTTITWQASILRGTFN